MVARLSPANRRTAYGSGRATTRQPRRPRGGRGMDGATALRVWVDYARGVSNLPRAGRWDVLRGCFVIKTRPEWLAANRANWDERVSIHLRSESYGLAPLRAG